MEDMTPKVLEPTEVIMQFWTAYRVESTGSRINSEQDTDIEMKKRQSPDQR